MNIERIEHSNMGSHLARAAGKPPRDIKQAREGPAVGTASPAEARVPTPTEPADGATTPEPTPQETTRGVIRLLEEGHFKGVADVRLRINFFDELSARAAQAAAPVLEEQATALLEVVSASVDELVGGFNVDEATAAAIDAAVAEFEAGLRDGVESIQSVDSGNLAGLAEALQTGFDALMTKLSDLLLAPASEPAPTSEPDGQPTDEMGAGDAAEPAADEVSGVGGETAAAPPAGPESSAEPTTTTGVDSEPVEPAVSDSDTGAAPTIEDALAALRATFEQALADLSAALTGAIDLGNPSEPTGNGAAYDKFLAMYNELRGLAASVDEQA